MIKFDLIPVISQIAELDIFLAKNTSCPLVLKFNTGMNRLGIGLEEIENVMQKLAAVGCTDIFHLMTHFANSYFPIKEGDRTHQQYEKFLAIKNLFLNHHNRGQHTHLETLFLHLKERCYFDNIRNHRQNIIQVHQQKALHCQNNFEHLLFDSHLQG